MVMTYKQFTRKLVADLKTHFLLSDWTIEVYWELPEEVNQDAPACIDVNDTYLYASLHLGNPMKRRWEEKEWDWFIGTMVHEFSHIITEPLYNLSLEGATVRTQKYVEETRERQTQRVANLVMRSIPKSFREGFDRPKRRPRKRRL